jgi:predicted deacylase
MQDIVAHCTHGIDLHTGSNHRSNLPQIRADMADPETRCLAQAFGAPVMLNAPMRDGSLRAAGGAQGVPIVLYEAGEGLRFDEFSIRVGVRGILAVMRSIGMLAASRRQRATVEPLVARSSTWVRAPISGILRTPIALGRHVMEQSPLGTIGDPFGDETVKVIAPVAGLVIGRLNLPLVYQGDALFHLARFDAATDVEGTLEAFEADLEGHTEVDPLDP